MKTEITNLRIENPCPFVPLNSNKNANGYSCKACKKTVIDFREKTIEEIKCTVNKDTCGIFTIDQLPGQQSMGLFKHLLFYCLTLLSVLGFTVKPLNAQTTRNSSDSLTVALKSNMIVNKSIEATSKNTKQTSYSKKKKGIFRKKKKTRVVGSVAF